jgi:acyl transferase domain-containing protein
MGDPIEAGAISDVFTPYRSSEDPMYVGAEHLEGAAGIAGLIKAVAVVESGIYSFKNLISLTIDRYLIYDPQA